MPAFVLLNGPPAAGKSTLAERLVEMWPLALNLDIDVIRSHLGGWLDAPHDAGLAARRLATAMATRHLEAGLDVVVPQFVGRVDFIEELEALAHAASATFIEVMLMLERTEAIDAFELRCAHPQDQTHRDAAELVRRSPLDDPVGEMYDAAQRVLERRPRTRQVPVTRTDIDATFEALLAVLHHGQSGV